MPPPPTAWTSRACHLRLWIVLAVVLAGDLVSKAWVFAALGEPTRGAHCTLWPGVLELQTQFNFGAALGILPGHRTLFMVAGLGAVAMFLLLFARSRPTQWFLQIGIALVLAGALGNAYDRAVYGKVRDFIHITAQFGPDLVGGWPKHGVYPWIFNVADMALVVGVIMMMLSLMRHGRRVSADRSAGGLEKASARR